MSQLVTVKQATFLEILSLYNDVREYLSRHLPTNGYDNQWPDALEKVRALGSLLKQTETVEVLDDDEFREFLEAEGLA